MKTIVFLDRATLSADLPAFPFPHRWVEYSSTTQEHVVQRCRDAQIVVTNKVPLTGEVFAQLPQLEVIGVPAAGVNHLDMKTCQQRSIEVVACPGYSTISVPEHAFALMLALRRNLVPYWNDVYAGGWSGSPTFHAELHPIEDLHGSTLGIVGAGHGGKRLAELAGASGMRVLFAERRHARAVREGYAAFDEVLREADVISLHCPLTDETRNLFGLAEFERMKRSASLVNAARGGIVDEGALIEALDRKLIANAALDVLEQEPPASATVFVAFGVRTMLSCRIVTFIVSIRGASSRESVPVPSPAGHSDLLLVRVDQYLPPAARGLPPLVVEVGGCQEFDRDRDRTAHPDARRAVARIRTGQSGAAGRQGGDYRIAPGRRKFVSRPRGTRFLSVPR